MSLEKHLATQFMLGRFVDAYVHVMERPGARPEKIGAHKLVLSR